MRFIERPREGEAAPREREGGEEKRRKGTGIRHRLDRLTTTST